MSVAPLALAGSLLAFLAPPAWLPAPLSGSHSATYAIAGPAASSPSGQSKEQAQADQAYFDGRWKEALDLYTRLLKRDDNNWQLWSRIGECHLQLGDPGQAVLAFQESLKRNVNSVNAFFAALASRSAGREAEALSLAHMALRLYVDARATARDPWSPASQRVLAPVLVPQLCAELVGLASGRRAGNEGLPELLKAAAAFAPDASQKAAIGESLGALHAAWGDYANASQLLGQARRIGVQVDQRPAAEGLRVSSVMKGMPADLAGIRAGDVITEVEGQSLANVLTAEPLVQAVAGMPIGATVRLAILRSGETLRRNVIVGVPPNLAELAAAASSPAAAAVSPLTSPVPPAPAGAAQAAPPPAVPAPAPEAPGPVASVVISRVGVKPNPVPAGAPFDVEYEYTVTDQKAGSPQITVEMSYTIRQGTTVLYTRPVERLSVPNGAARFSIEHLNPSSQAGRYEVTVSLRYGQVTAEKSAEFQIM